MAEMPADWTDVAGWEMYYWGCLSNGGSWNGDHLGSIRLEDLPKIAEGLKAEGWTSVWTPGCGLSPLGRLLAHVGLKVVATDVSRTAIDFQRSANAAKQFAHLTAKLGKADSAGEFTAEAHDFRDEFRREAFDLIFNVKAIQGFKPPDMVRIARSHAVALRPGRKAYFDTMNVQGERRDQLEQALEDGGFIVPLMALDRWYRQALQATGIPHGFILGRPMIPHTGEYLDDRPKWERDMARLREIGAEYERRLPEEDEAEARRIGPDARLALVIYSTG